MKTINIKKRWPNIIRALVAASGLSEDTIISFLTQYMREFRPLHYKLLIRSELHRGRKILQELEPNLWLTHI
jgi:hypothetical protein